MTPRPAFIWTSLTMMLLAAPALAGEQLIVFTQPDASAVAESFQREHLPAIESLADDMGVELKVVDVAAGVPRDVGITPLIVYQNHRGRSIYQGRYATPMRIKNFIRTARHVPKADAALTLTDLYTHDLGRATVGSPIKITDLAGAVPEGFDQAAFKKQMHAALAEGFERFKPVASADFARTDRLFYMDLYPYRSDDGKLFIGIALFSQFHCHDPVFIQTDEPVTGSWDDRAAVFADAARALEEQVAHQIAQSAIGDGFDVISPTVPTETYEQLGLPLPPKPAGAVAQAPIDTELPTRWTVDTAAAQSEAMIQFAFAPPLDGYAGEVTQLTGSLNLGTDALSQTTGKLTVQTNSLTMGEEDLDAHIHDGLLFVVEHPSAHFTVTAIQTDHTTIEWAQITPIVLHGKFTLMDQTIDLAVPASIETYITDDGSPRLELIGAWQLQINDTWGLEGPPGPAESQNTMDFRCRIVMKPATLTR